MKATTDFQTEYMKLRSTLSDDVLKRLTNRNFYNYEMSNCYTNFVTGARSIEVGPCMLYERGRIAITKQLVRHPDTRRRAARMLGVEVELASKFKHKLRAPDGTKISKSVIRSDVLLWDQEHNRVVNATQCEWESPAGVPQPKYQIQVRIHDRQKDSIAQERLTTAIGRLHTQFELEAYPGPAYWFPSDTQINELRHWMQRPDYVSPTGATQTLITREACTLRQKTKTLVEIVNKIVNEYNYVETMFDYLEVI